MATRSKMSGRLSVNDFKYGAQESERTVDEGVENAHGTVGDTGVGVDLLED